MSDFKAKMHQNPKFGWGSAPDPAEGAYSAPPDLDLRGPTSKGEEWRGWKGRGGRKRGGEGGERDGTGREVRRVLWSPKNPGRLGWPSTATVSTSDKWHCSCSVNHGSEPVSHWPVLV